MSRNPAGACGSRPAPTGATGDASRHEPLWYRESQIPAPRLSPFPPMPTVRPNAARAQPPADRGGSTWSISDLAQEFALTTRAIRFYEDEGLLSPRRKGTARIYGERERTRIKLILRGKRLGLSLSEIGELFDLYEATRSERPQLAKFLQMLSDRRAMLAQQREDIDAVLAEIGALERECRRRLKRGEDAAPTAGARPGGE
jgi:DNA-binding transcriptional MerR regulator